MGTSASGGGAGGSNPLIPSWIGGGGGGLPPTPPGPEQQGNNDGDTNGQGDNGAGNGDNDNADNNNGGGIHPNAGHSNPPQETSEMGRGNRYTAPRRQFNRFVRSGGSNSQALKKALKGYSRSAAGDTRQLAVRMQPSASRVATFYEVINTVREQGSQQALVQFNLRSYQSKPLLDVLSALSDAIFRDTGKIYEDTQDDSITKHAYANTVTRICELDGLDLDHLTNEQVEVMMAIFIEETIAQRVINDVGNNLTENTTNIAELVEMENNIYQIVSGLVRNQIMPEIVATQLGDRQNLDKKIENIYRIAFDAMAGQND
jgi:hypothetical protein